MNLGWGSGRAGKYLLLEDIAVLVRHPDGSFTFDRKPFSGIANILVCTCGFPRRPGVGHPADRRTIGAILGTTGTAATQVGISEDFVHDVEALMKPGTSACSSWTTTGIWK